MLVLVSSYWQGWLRVLEDSASHTQYQYIDRMNLDRIPGRVSINVSLADVISIFKLSILFSLQIQHNNYLSHKKHKLNTIKNPII